MSRKTTLWASVADSFDETGLSGIPVSIARLAMSEDEFVAEVRRHLADQAIAGG